MPTPPTSDNDVLFTLAFVNSAQPNIISIVSSGKIMTANKAACKLLGYSKRELLTKMRSSIFDITDKRFIQLMKERSAEGHSTGKVKLIRKSGKALLCEITSAVFIGEHGIEKSITSITDLTKAIKEQKLIDVAREALELKSAAKKIKTKKKNVLIDHKTDSMNIAGHELNMEMPHDTLVAKKETNKAWIKYIARSSYDVMWDWDIVTGNIYVGDSIEEVFGYKVPGNNIAFSELNNLLLTTDSKSALRKLLVSLKTDSKNWSASFTINRADGSIASVNSRGSIVRDKEGKALRMIGATQDITRVKELEAFKTEHEEVTNKSYDMVKMVAKLSYDGIWDWNIETNEFFMGDGFEELFGSKVTSNVKPFNWMDFLHPEDKERVQQGFENAIASSSTSWEDSYRFVKTDGTIADVFGRANIVRDEKGKAIRMIGAIHDLSRQKDLEEILLQEMNAAKVLLSEYKENFNLVFNSSSDILYDIDISTNAIKLSDGYQTEFGYPNLPDMTTADVWPKHIHPDDKVAVLHDYESMMASSEGQWRNSYRFIRADGSIANIVSSRVLMRRQDGVIYRMIGSMHDISKETVLEEKLAEEIQLKEYQIANAIDDARDAARAEMGKELHDNVNQLLGVSRLYLEMAKRGGADSEAHLSRSSQYTMSAIEEIRKLSKTISTDNLQIFGLSQSIKDLANVSMEISAIKITCQLDSKIDVFLNESYKMNLFRIIQEQLNNILKHAKAKKVNIRLSQKKQIVLLDISDDGIGFDTDQKRDGVGIQNIKSRAATIHGDVSFVSSVGKGCHLRVSLDLQATDAGKREISEGRG